MRGTDDEQVILRKYLLHDLAEAEQERVELRLLTDKEFRRRAAMAQDDLIDDFVAGNLSGGESESFRKHFMTTPARRHKLNFAAALDRYVTDRAEAASWFEKLLAFGRAHPLRTALSAAAALLILAAAFNVVFRPGWFRPAPAQEFRREFARVNRSRETASAPLSELRRSSADAVALTLRENVVREGGSPGSVEIKSGVTLVRLLLEVTSGPYERYRAELQTADGREIATAEDLKARDEDGAQFVVVEVPAARLPRGAYRLRLSGISGDGRATDLVPYSFELSR